MGEMFPYEPAGAEAEVPAADIEVNLQFHISHCIAEIAMLEREGPTSNFDPVVIRGHIELSKQELAELLRLDPATATTEIINNIVQDYSNRCNQLVQQRAA